MAFDRLQAQAVKFFDGVAHDPVQAVTFAALVVLLVVFLWVFIPGFLRAIFGKKKVVEVAKVSDIKAGHPQVVVEKASTPQKVYVESVPTVVGKLKFSLPDTPLTRREKWLIAVAAQATRQKLQPKPKKGN